MRAIVFKELRENLKWLPVGVLLIGIFAWLACPVNAQNVYNTSTANLTFSIAIGAGLYAVLLGGLQSVFDFSDRQRGFLLHRGDSQTRLVSGCIAGDGGWRRTVSGWTPKAFISSIGSRVR